MATLKNKGQLDVFRFESQLKSVQTLVSESRRWRRRPCDASNFPGTMDSNLDKINQK
jgi:hypothetical protein